MPRKELLDPQGKVVTKNLPRIDVHGVKDVRIGKYVTLQLEAETEEKARQDVERSCNQLLVNKIMETYSYQLEKV